MGCLKSVVSIGWSGCFTLIAALFISSCGEDEKIIEKSIFPPDTTANVLQNLQVSYLKGNSAEYGKLLADDFRFYFDEGTRQQNHNLPVFWTRDEDSTQTAALFSSPRVTDIRILLQFGEPRPAQEPGRPGWVYVDVLDTFLEVDLAPLAGETEGLTLRVDGQQQRFYFRKGRNPEDTGSESWYLVEWKDFGMADGGKGGFRDRLLTEDTTWSRIKSFF